MNADGNAGKVGLLLVDSSLVYFRAKEAMPDLRNSAGVPTGMEYGTLRILEMLEKRHPLHRIVLCRDSARSWRKERYPHYKANREKSSSIHGDRRAALEGFLNTRFHHASATNEEADDVMAFLAAREPGSHLLYTNDKDLLQCVSVRSVVLKSHNYSEYAWDAERIREEFGVPPPALPMLRALLGDPSDNLPGVKRVDKELLAECARIALDALVDAPEVALNKRYFAALTAALAEYELHDRWTEKERAAIREFVEAGHLKSNLELMTLLGRRIETTILRPSPNDEAARRYLELLEIRSLRMCKELGVFAAEAAGEEF